jgi:Undecaprenyl-phosphate glucose phosphotransferase
MLIANDFLKTRNRRGYDGAQITVERPERLSKVLYRVVGIEIVTIFLAACLSIHFYYWIALGAQVSPSLYIPAALVIAILVVLVAVGFHHYAKIRSHRKRWYVTVGIGAVGLAFSLFLSLLFLLKVADQYSRGAFFVQLITVSLTIIIVRTITHNKLRASIARNEIEARRVVLIGRNAHCDQVMRRLVDSGLRIQAIIPFPSIDATSSNDTATKGNVFRQIARRCRPLCPDDILVLATERDLPNVELLAGALSEIPASLHMMPIGLENILAISKFSELGLMPTIQMSQPPLSLFDRFIKRTFDLIGALTGLILLFPLLVAVAAVILLESGGPVIFRQSRHGFNNKPIRVFKFRTMRTIEEGDNFTQAVRNDSRVTKVGNILRRTNIDELPQLFNVLLGEMSLVGPRPHPIALNEKFEKKLLPLFRRHNVKPGLTGWAQVNGCRGETDTLEKMERRLRYDLYYVDHWSFLFDLQIIMLTLCSKKAYSNAY